VSELDHHLSEVSAREIREWERGIDALRTLWYNEAICPTMGSMIDNAYKQGILPLPPLDINGDGVWTRKEPWYRAMEG